MHAVDDSSAPRLGQSAQIRHLARCEIILAVASGRAPEWSLRLAVIDDRQPCSELNRVTMRDNVEVATAELQRSMLGANIAVGAAGCRYTRLALGEAADRPPSSCLLELRRQVMEDRGRTTCS